MELGLEYYKLPGEQFFEDVIGADAASGDHFPNVFKSVQNALQRHLTRKVFLIAGGISGNYTATRSRKMEASRLISARWRMSGSYVQPEVDTTRLLIWRYQVYSLSSRTLSHCSLQADRVPNLVGPDREVTKRLFMLR